MLKVRVLIATIFLIFCVSIYSFDQVYVEISTNVEGQVIPSGKIRKIQNLEGGIVKTIKVQEGMRVNKGDVLIELDMIISESELGEINSRLAFLETELIYLNAILKSQKPVINNKIKNKYSEIYSSSFVKFNTLKNNLNAKLKFQRNKISEFKNSIKLSNKQLENKMLSIKTIDEQIIISEELLKKNITSRLKHLDLIKEKQILISQSDQIIKEIESFKSEIKSIKINIQVIEKEYFEKISEKINLYVEEKQKYKNRLRRYEDKLTRKIIKSPIQGTIKEIHVFTKGGVIKPGQEILSIVPNNEQLIIDAKLNVQDIGYAKIGQKALIRLKGTDSFLFTPVIGKISLISPDSKIDEDGESYYNIKIKTFSDRFTNGKKEFSLYPGLTVDCNIIIGKRSVLENILAPFYSFKGTLLTENVWTL